MISIAEYKSDKRKIINDFSQYFLNDEKYCEKLLV